MEDIAGYYDRQERKFYAVVSLGREVGGGGGRWGATGDPPSAVVRSVPP